MLVFAILIFLLFFSLRDSKRKKQETEEKSEKEQISFEEVLKKYGKTEPSDNKIDTENQNYKLENTPSLKEQFYNQEEEIYSDNKTNTESFNILKAEETNANKEEILEDNNTSDNKKVSNDLKIAKWDDMPKIEKLDIDEN